jgi:hypothetical protein
MIEPINKMHDIVVSRVADIARAAATIRPDAPAVAAPDRF